MFGPFERMVAFRYLRARKGEKFVSIIAIFSLLGITLGVATLIIVMSVMNGFRQDLLGRILGLNGHVVVQARPGQPLADFTALAERLAAMPGVTQVSPGIEGQVLLTSEEGGAGAGLVRGIAPEALRARQVVAGRIIRGSLGDFAGEDAVVIGARLANRMGLRIGDRLTLVLPQARGADFSAAPRTRGFRVVAMFDLGMPEYDSRNIFLPLQAAQSFFQLPDAVNQLELFAAEPREVRPLAQAVRQVVAGRTLRVTDWQESNSSLYGALLVERNVMFLVLALIVLVAAFNIISSLTMLVKDKGRDIAILRTMGATSGSVLRIFLLCGATVGCGGTLIGFALGLLFCTNFDAIRAGLMALQGTPLFSPELLYLTQLPVLVDPQEVAQVLLMGLGLSLLATLYPSWRAARIDPVQGLRHG